MVAANPLFAGGSYYKKFQATVINDIWPEVLFFSLVGTSKSSLASTYLDVSPAPLSGHTRVRNDLHKALDIKPDVDRTWYGARSGHLLPNVDCLRTVSGIRTVYYGAYYKRSLGALTSFPLLQVLGGSQALDQHRNRI